MISALVLVLASGAVHPQIVECAAAVRAQGNVDAACQDPQIVLFPKNGQEPSTTLTAQCAAALFAGRAVGKVPASKADVMRADFEKKMASCEASAVKPAVQPKKRETVKLWD